MPCSGMCVGAKMSCLSGDAVLHGRDAPCADTGLRWCGDSDVPMAITFGMLGVACGMPADTGNLYAARATEDVTLMSLRAEDSDSAIKLEALLASELD